MKKFTNKDYFTEMYAIDYDLTFLELTTREWYILKNRLHRICNHLKTRGLI